MLALFGSARYYRGVQLRKYITTIVRMLVMPLLVFMPGRAFADTATPGTLPTPVLITEVQPGSPNSASEEFIELYNTSDQAVDFGANHWQVVRTSSTATSWDNPAGSVDLTGTLLPGQTAIVGSSYSSGGQTTHYGPAGTTPIAWMAAGLTPAAGHVRLTYQANILSDDQAACTPSVVVSDEVEWSTVKDNQLTAPSLDAGHAPFPVTTSGGIAKTQSLERKVTDGIYVDTDLEAQDFILADPSPGQPGYAGAAVNMDPPFSAGQGVMPFDQCQPDQSATGAPAGGGLQLPTTSPPAIVEATEDSNGGATAPATIPSADIGLTAPQISELLPNPASPQTDAADEFIELYNTNTVPFNLSGFVLEVGTTTLHRYTFPNGSMLAPQSFTAFFSADTHLNMSNTSGQVRLLDPLGTVIGQSDPYGTAKDGQAWALAQGQWQWTTKPTPNATNVIAVPMTSVKKSSSTKSTSRAGSTSSAKSKSKQSAAIADNQNTAPVTPSTPLHTAVLAIVGVFALLYGAYEYRHDVANRIYQLRRHRAARAAARASPEGR